MTANTRKQVSQRLSLLKETELSISLLSSGLAILQQSRPYEFKCFSFMLLLATGLERLMKIVLCLHAFEATGEFPSKEYLKGLGHDLVRLRNEVLRACYTQEYLKLPFARTDHDFIEQDALFNHMLILLSDFAQSDRYIHMDSIADPQGREWPELRWEELERQTMPSDVYWSLVQEGKLDELKQHSNQQFVANIEKFIRALTRLFAFAGLGDLARSNSVTTWGFMKLEDEQLGRRHYEA